MNISVDWQTALIEYLPFFALICFNLTIIFDLSTLTYALTVTHDELYPGEVTVQQKYKKLINISNPFI